MSATASYIAFGLLLVIVAAGIVALIIIDNRAYRKDREAMRRLLNSDWRNL